MITLEEVCEINPKKSEVKLSKDSDISFVPMADLSDDSMFFTSKQTKKIKEVSTGYTYFTNDDILLAKVTPCFENGKAGLAKDLEKGIGFGSSEFIILRPSNRILPELVYGIIRSSDFVDTGKLQMTGTGGLQRIPIDFVKKYKFPLPALETQKEIVEQMKDEEKIINSNKKLIEIMENKISRLILEL